VSAKRTDGATPLYVAEHNGYSEIVKLLLQHGATPLATT